MLPDEEHLLEETELEEPTYTIAEGNLQRYHFVCKIYNLLCSYFSKTIFWVKAKASV